ncbi:hypothetical protein BVY02_02455 [bacterium J17]|nr:hypothetical protein BVY02_02455 [bacterium J17]
MPLDTNNGSVVLELSKVTGSSIVVNIKIYSHRGELLSNLNFILPPHALQHIISDQILEINKFGSAVVNSSSPSSPTAVSMHYNRASDSSIKHIDATPAREPFGNVL